MGKDTCSGRVGWNGVRFQNTESVGVQGPGWVSFSDKCLKRRGWECVYVVVVVEVFQYFKWQGVGEWDVAICRLLIKGRIVRVEGRCARSVKTGGWQAMQATTVLSQSFLIAKTAKKHRRSQRWSTVLPASGRWRRETRCMKMRGNDSTRAASSFVRCSTSPAAAEMFDPKSKSKIKNQKSKSTTY